MKIKLTIFFLTFSSILFSQVKSNSLYDILGTNVYAQSTLDIVDCALTALGLPAGLVIGTAGKLTTKVILKTAAKLAGKAIGWVALAISVYTFARCVDKLPNNDSSAMFFPNNDNKLNLWKQLT